MSLSDTISEETEAEQRWNQVHPPKGSVLMLRGIEFLVVRETPLTVRGPSGNDRVLPSETLARMEVRRP